MLGGVMEASCQNPEKRNAGPGPAVADEVPRANPGRAKRTPQPQRHDERKMLCLTREQGLVTPGRWTSLTPPLPNRLLLLHHPSWRKRGEQALKLPTCKTPSAWTSYACFSKKSPCPSRLTPKTPLESLPFIDLRFSPAVSILISSSNFPNRPCPSLVGIASPICPLKYFRHHRRVA